MAESELQRDKRVTREVHRLFWRAMFYTPRYFVPTITFYLPAFFIMNVYIPLQVAYGIQAIITRHFDRVGHYVIAVILITVIGQLLYGIATWTFNRNGIYGGTFVQNEMFANYLDKDYEFFGSNYIGALGVQAARIKDAFTDYNRFAMFEIPRNIVIIVASLAVLAVKSPLLALITVGCMTVTLSVTLLFAKYRLKYRRLVSQANSEVSGVLGDSLSHGAAVKSFAQEAHEQQRAKKPMRDWEAAQLKSWDLFIPGNALRNLFMAVTMAVLLLASAHLYREGKIQIAIIALVQLYVIRLMNVTNDVADLIKTYETIMSTSYQAVATTLVPGTIIDPGQPKKLSGKKTYGISFNEVTYHYPEAAKGSDAVSGFSLNVANGEKIGLVGYSGGGKTTITKLLLRFMDVDNGGIQIDGIDVRQAAQAELRTLVAYVPQEPLLFHRSIRENIAYARPNAPQKAIAKAAKTAYVDEFVKDLPTGYDAMVGERGVKLSGGQRQRVAIARALLKDAPILVLDEATSALDSQSEQYIQKALWELMEDRTAIVIAHRLSTIQRMDRIVVMDKGRIVQTGSHQELLKDDKGIYARLWARQSGGYLGEEPG
jgi:ATP-binding cassette subfamily B protein